MQSRQARLARVARSEVARPVRVAQTVPLARSLRAAPGMRIRRARIVPLDAVVPVVVRSRRARRARAVPSARLRWLTSCRAPKVARVPVAAAVPAGVARRPMVVVVRVGMGWLPAVAMMLLAAVPARAVPLGIAGVSSALQSR